MAKSITPNPPANITGVTLANPTGTSGTYELKYKKHDLLFDAEYEENAKDAVNDLELENSYLHCPVPWLSLDSSQKKFGNKSLKIVSPYISTGESFTLTLFDNDSLYQDALAIPSPYTTMIAAIFIHLSGGMVGVEENIMSPNGEDTQSNWIHPDSTTAGTIANIVSKMSDPDSDAYPLVSVTSDGVDTITITAKQDIIVFAVNGLYFTTSVCPSSGFAYAGFISAPTEGVTSICNYYPLEDVNFPGIGLLPADTWSRIIVSADNNYVYYFLNETLVAKAEMPSPMFPVSFPAPAPALPSTKDYWIDSVQTLSGVIWDDSFPLSDEPLSSCTFLSWGDGPQIEITADGTYTLDDGNGNTIDVIVDYSALSSTDESDDIIIATSSLDADPLRKCPACGTIFLEDARMYDRPEVCPNCGTSLSQNFEI